MRTRNIVKFTFKRETLLDALKKKKKFLYVFGVLTAEYTDNR